MPGKESQFTATEAETHDFGVEGAEEARRDTFSRLAKSNFQASQEQLRADQAYLDEHILPALASSLHVVLAERPAKPLHRLSELLLTQQAKNHL